MKASIFRLLVLIGLIVSVQVAGRAQSTIFNVPTTDTVDKGRVYFEFDFLPQLPKTDFANRSYIYNPRLVVGVGSDIEAGVNVPSTHISPTTNVVLEPNIEWRFLNNDAKGLAAAGGVILFTPANHRGSSPTYGQLYGVFSKDVKSSDHGPRFELGAYGVVHAGDSWFGPKAGVMAGYEQPITSTLSFVADWLSGQNALGYFTPGMQLTLPLNGVFSAGYSLGNNSYSGNGNRFLVLYYGVTF